MKRYLDIIKKLLNEIKVCNFYGDELSYEEGINDIVNCIWECKIEKKHYIYVAMVAARG